MAEWNSSLRVEELPNVESKTLTNSSSSSSSSAAAVPALELSLESSPKKILVLLTSLLSSIVLRTSSEPPTSSSSLAVFSSFSFLAFGDGDLDPLPMTLRCSRMARSTVWRFLSSFFCSFLSFFLSWTSGLLS